MKLTKETLIELIKEEINEMARWRQPGNAPPGTFKKPHRRGITSEPRPEASEEEIRLAAKRGAKTFADQMIRSRLATEASRESLMKQFEDNWLKSNGLEPKQEEPETPVSEMPV